MLTVVVFKGRNVPSALSPAQIAETVLYSVVPPAPGSSQVNTIAHPHGHMTVLQLPLLDDNTSALNSQLAAAVVQEQSLTELEESTSQQSGGLGVAIGDSFDEGVCPAVSALGSNVREWDVNDVLGWMCQFEPLRSKSYEREIRRRKVGNVLEKVEDVWLGLTQKLALSFVTGDWGRSFVHYIIGSGKCVYFRNRSDAEAHQFELCFIFLTRTDRKFGYTFDPT